MSRTPELLVLQGARTELTVRWSPAPALHYRDVLPVTTFAVLTLRRDTDPVGALARYTVVHLHGSVHAAPLGSAP
jgi:hypothetical protein